MWPRERGCDAYCPTSIFFSSDFGNSHDPAGLGLASGHVPPRAPRGYATVSDRETRTAHHCSCSIHYEEIEEGENTKISHGQTAPLHEANPVCLWRCKPTRVKPN